MADADEQGVDAAGRLAARVDERLAAPERLAAIDRSGLFDTPPEQSMDRVARLGSRLLDVPVVLVSVVGAGRQFLKSAVGVGEPWVSGNDTPLSHSFCRYVVAGGAPFVVEDARTHPLVTDSLALEELSVVAYLGVPLRDPDDEVLGAFCAIDHQPRRWSADDQQLLVELAEAVTTELRLRQLARELEDEADAQRSAREYADSASAARLRALADNAADVIYEFRLSPQLGMTYMNPAVEELTGHPSEAFLEDPALLAACVHPDDIEAVRTAQLSPTAEAVEFRVVRRDGSQVWAAMRTAQVTSVDGAIVAVQGIIRDIDRQKRQEAALVAAAEQQQLTAEELQRVVAMRSSFLTAISHEMRTPLTVVLGFAEVLQRHDQKLDPGRRQELLARLRTSAQRLDGLLSDILDVRQLEVGGGGALDPSVRLDDLVTEALGEVDVDVDQLELELEPTVVAVDETRLRRAIHHLLTNAVVHTPVGTPIRIVVRPDEAGGARLTVQDRGPGIPDDLKDRVLEPFVQGPERAQAASPGTGIGLALANELVRAHGGNIAIADTPGGGATVEVFLP